MDREISIVSETAVESWSEYINQLVNVLPKNDATDETNDNLKCQEDDVLLLESSKENEDGNALLLFLSPQKTTVPAESYVLRNDSGIRGESLHGNFVNKSIEDNDKTSQEENTSKTLSLQKMFPDKFGDCDVRCLMANPWKYRPILNTPALDQVGDTKHVDMVFVGDYTKCINCDVNQAEDVSIEDVSKEDEEIYKTMDPKELIISIPKETENKEVPEFDETWKTDDDEDYEIGNRIEYSVTTEKAFPPEYNFHALVNNGSAIIEESGNFENQRNETILEDTLKNILELKDGGSESLTHIISVINETYAETTAATVHECLVNAFPNVQTQQSNDQDEIYYLGIKLNSYMTTAERVDEWLKRRFKEYRYGKMAVGTVADIARKEIGFQNRIGTYLRKAFPKVYVRKSDRLRWYFGIVLSELVMTDVVDKETEEWLDKTCEWLRQNMKQTEHGREKCSMVFASLRQYVGNIGVENQRVALYHVFSTLKRKTFKGQAYYCGIQFADHVDRDDIHISKRKTVKSDL